MKTTNGSASSQADSTVAREEIAPELGRPGSLWRLYLFISALSFVIGIGVLVLQWENVKAQAKTELRYANGLVANSLDVLLHKYEAMLEVLGERLLEVGALKGKNRAARRLVDRLLERNQELAGFGLATPDGHLVLTSSNIDRSRLPNLRTSASTSASFKQALRSHHMVIGRSYYMPALRQWVIPLRYSLRDDQGRVVAVMTTGLKMDRTEGIWSKKALPRHMLFLVIRKDMYRQFGSYVRRKDYAKYYGKPVTPEYLAYFRRQLYQQTGLQDRDLRDPSRLAIFFVTDTKGRVLLTSLRFEPRYDYFVLAAIPRQVLFGRMRLPVFWVLALLVVFNLVLYVVFRITVRIQRQATRQLQHLATHDQLTGLPNRWFLTREFAHWKSNGRQRFCVLFVDLDNFKAINDLHGHSIGDVILREVARRIRRSFSGALTIRQGGDEFIVLVSGQYGEVIEESCRQFIDMLREPIAGDGHAFSIRASIGVAQFPVDGTSLDELLRKADMAMYEAKRVHCGILAYAEQLERGYERRSQIENELASALEKREFYLVYQPQIGIGDNGVLGLEALLRWHSPILGDVSPDEMIPVAESVGIMRDLGLFVIDQARRDAEALLAGGVFEQYFSRGGLRLSVNASVSQLFDEVFIAALTATADALREHAIEFVVEVTESLFIEDVERARELLSRLQAQGVGVSLDDFGTGYSSLSLLSKLPIGELKIDKSFVQDIETDTYDRQLTRDIIHLGQGLGIPVLAEGVETAEQARLLAGFGCGRFQGYLFARPMRFEDLQDWIRAGAVDASVLALVS